MNNGRDCKHGQLARACEICSMESENAELRRRFDSVVEQRNNLMISDGLNKLKKGKFWKPGNPMTATKINNYFNRSYPGRSSTSRHNFQLGVRFAEQVHKIGEQL